MMKELNVATIPVAKGRPRVGRYAIYTPAKTADAEALIKRSWLGKFGSQPCSGPLYLEARAYLPRPLAHFGSGRNSQFVKESAPIYPLARPDIDNLGKLALDALNGVAFADDSQLIDVHFSKRYCDVPPEIGFVGWEIRLWDRLPGGEDGL